MRVGIAVRAKRDARRRCRLERRRVEHGLELEHLRREREPRLLVRAPGGLVALWNHERELRTPTLPAHALRFVRAAARSVLRCRARPPRPARTARRTRRRRARDAAKDRSSAAASASAACPGCCSARRRRRSPPRFPAESPGYSGSTRPPSSSGLGRRPFTPVARVRIPLGVPDYAALVRSTGGAGGS